MTALGHHARRPARSWAERYEQGDPAPPRHSPRCQADQGDPACRRCAFDAAEAQALADYLDAYEPGESS